MKIVAAAILLASFSAFPAQGYFLDGNALKDECDKNSLICTGYIEGVADGIHLSQARGGLDMCPGEGVRLEQVIDATKKYLTDYPGRRTYPAGTLIFLAIEENFVCPALPGSALLPQKPAPNTSRAAGRPK